MYLKALEIQGFKSFPEKTVLTFGADITVIVGPNGSGKSNIADAIRWVMGEQSTRTLRGNKMEDVIFDGTAKRKSLGFAEVTLVLDNSQHLLDLEEQEVAVTRRYYRSGESEYYINRRSCRLRDINELFMDTGLGREGYSIIGQGKIDEILSVKSSDRREVFEEAAGISKYRHRKEEAERKLQRTEENLVRINDKIGELELRPCGRNWRGSTSRRKDMPSRCSSMRCRPRRFGGLRATWSSKCTRDRTSWSCCAGTRRTTPTTSSAFRTSWSNRRAGPGLWPSRCSSAGNA